MNNLRTFLTFESTIPDGFEFSEHGEILVPGGREVVLAIMGVVESHGFTISEPTQYQFYGWEVIAKKDGQEYWFLLQYPETWLLITKDRTGIIGRIKTKEFSLQRVLSEINQKLITDDRFSNVLWFSKEEYEAKIT